MTAMSNDEWLVWDAERRLLGDDGFQQRLGERVLALIGGKGNPQLSTHSSFIANALRFALQMELNASGLEDVTFQVEHLADQRFRVHMRDWPHFNQLTTLDIHFTP